MNTTETRSEEEVRLYKLKNLQKKGINPYPSKSCRSHTVAELLANFEELKSVTLTGRIRSLRRHGGSTFAHVEDDSGKVQVYFKKDEIGNEQYEVLSNFIDVGDILEVEGSPFTTKRGENSLLITHYSILAKALLPLPEKWHGLSDTEIRYRQRYLDLLSNPEVKEMFKTRTKLVRSTQDFFDKKGFIEVETPVLQPLYGGASAKPFTTFHNALDCEFYLRISDELYLKRLIAGGFEKVYEIGKDFRNEGIDREHNPEFTMMEFYWAYADYEDGMKLTEEFLEYMVKEVKGSLKVEYEGNTIDFTPPYKRKTFRQLLIEYADFDIEKYSEKEDLIMATKEKGFEVEKEWGRGKILDELYKELVRPHLVGPVFVTDHPVELSPLAKKKADDENYVERYQLVVASREIINAYTELNDPIDQENRFKDQEKQFTEGDTEAQRIDEDFIAALKHGMPPTTGWGMGIDRITAILTGAHSIKEVILFPTLKSK